MYLTRILNSESGSPFLNHIRLGVQDNLEIESNGYWRVSMATIVDGILSLISSNPKKDRDLMHKKSVNRGRNRTDLRNSDKSPLRKLFIEGNDKGLFELLYSFFISAAEIFWAKAPERSYIRKTVGIQALFDILRLILSQSGADNFHRELFSAKLRKAAHVDFSNSFFQASGTGRGRIRNVIGICAGIIELGAIKTSDEDKLMYKQICFSGKK